MTAYLDRDATFPPSPVPSDADLWPGELPFTAWGQWAYGRLDLRVFDQDVWWVDIGQRPHRLTEMPWSYITNVVAFLARDAEYFFHETMRRGVLQIWGDLLLGRVPTDLVVHSLGAPALTDLTPSQWLEATPLMRALRARAVQGDDRDAQ